MHFHTKALDHFQVQDSLCATKVNSEKAAIKKGKAPVSQGSFFGSGSIISEMCQKN